MILRFQIFRPFSFFRPSRHSLHSRPAGVAQRVGGSWQILSGRSTACIFTRYQHSSGFKPAKYQQFIPDPFYARCTSMANPTRTRSPMSRPRRPRPPYAIDATKIHRELGCKPQESFETGIRKSIPAKIINICYGYALNFSYDQKRALYFRELD